MIMINMINILIFTNIFTSIIAYYTKDAERLIIHDVPTKEFFPYYLSLLFNKFLNLIAFLFKSFL